MLVYIKLDKHVPTFYHDVFATYFAVFLHSVHRYGWYAWN